MSQNIPNNIFQNKAEELSGFTNWAYNPRPHAEGCMRGVNQSAEVCNI